MKQLKAVTLKGVKLTVSINPSGFVKVSDGRKSKSQAQITFARAYLANPSAVEITPLENGVNVQLADGSCWFINADELLISRVEKVSQMAAMQVEQDQDTQPKGGEAEVTTMEESVNGTEQRKPKRGLTRIIEALSSVLKSQGFSDQQVDEILAALDQHQASTKRHKFEFDLSTPEGKLMNALARLHKSFARAVRYDAFEVRIENFQIRSPRIEGLEFRFENGTVFCILNGEVVAQFPPAN